MHDLNTIIKQNATAFSASIDAQRAAGKYVITYHDGVHLMGYTTYDSAHAAAAKLNVLATGALASERYTLLPPLPSFYAAKRDQSEDREKPGAALDSGEFIPAEQLNKAHSGPVQTLGQYLARKA